MPQGAFNEIIISYQYDNFILNAVDTKFLTADTIPSGNNVLNYVSTFNVKLLEIEFSLFLLRYNNLLAGEASWRKITSYDCTFIPKKDGNTILNEYGIVENAVFSEEKKIVSFGQGIIVDDVQLPLSMNSIIIDNLPPANNSPFVLFANAVLRYNNNVFF